MNLQSPRIFEGKLAPTSRASGRPRTPTGKTLSMNRAMPTHGVRCTDFVAAIARQRIYAPL